MSATKLIDLADDQWTLVAEATDTVAIQLRQGTARIAVSDEAPTNLDDSFILAEIGPRQLSMGGMKEVNVYARSTPLGQYGKTQIVVLAI